MSVALTVFFWGFFCYFEYSLNKVGSPTLLIAIFEGMGVDLRPKPEIAFLIVLMLVHYLCGFGAMILVFAGMTLQLYATARIMRALVCTKK